MVQAASGSQEPGCGGPRNYSINDVVIGFAEAPTSVYLGPLVPPVERHLCAPIAQQAERLHGKEKVCGSIPHGGSDSVSGATAHRRNMRSIQIVARPGKLVAETTAG